jgi:hypothetical protein
MHKFRIFFKIIVLTGIGFIVPVVLLLPVEYMLSEFGSRPNWQTVLERYLPPCVGCSVLFLASAITSSTRRQVVTFVQSMFLHSVTFIVSAFAFVPIQHVKSNDMQPAPSSFIPFLAGFVVFIVLFICGNTPIASSGSATASKEVD